MANPITITQAVQLAPLSADGRALIAGADTPAAGVDRLVAKGLYEDACAFTAYALPARDAIWWGCLCAWGHVRPRPPEPEAEAFRSVMRWMQRPNEETRRAAHQAAEHAGLNTPAGCMAQAVFCSQGNVSRPGLPAVEAPAGLAARIVLAGLHVSAAREDPGRIALCFRRYLDMAREPLQRLSPLPSSKTASSPDDGSIAREWMDEAVRSPTAPHPTSPKHAHKLTWKSDEHGRPT